MSETKYTKDGKKVAVLGKLNAEEYIVQEIFVVEGQEVPGGENFTAKGLLDKPGESWKEKNLRELEQRYERDRKAWQQRIERQRRELGDAHKKAELRAKALFGFANNSENHQLQALIDFMAGRIRYAYIGGGANKIVAFDDDIFFQKKDFRGEIEELKLITVMGRTNGDLAFRLHRYSDGSGGMGYEIMFAKTYDEALSYAQQDLERQASTWLERGGQGYMNFDAWESIEGIEIPAAAQELRKKKKEEARRAKIDKLRKELAELEANG